MKQQFRRALLLLTCALLTTASVCNSQSAPVPEFFGIYATTDGKLIPLSGGRGSFTPSQKILTVFDWYDMNQQEQKILHLEGSDLRFLVFDAAVADTSAAVELYKLPFARSILPQQDALGQVGGLLGQISHQPQPKSPPVSIQKYVVAKTDALKINLLQKPIPGQPQMIQLVPEAPLEPGTYSVFALRSQGGQQKIIAVPFDWNSSSPEAAKPFCVDLAITGGYGGSMENHDARMEHPYYLPRQKYVECAGSAASNSASFGRTGSNGNGGGGGSAACNGYKDCFAAGIESYETSNLAEAMANFQAASASDPKQGEAWYWQGVVLLRDGQPHTVGELAGLWDKSLSLGRTVIISACHERGFQPCERGELWLSKSAVSFRVGREQQIFSAAPSEVEPGKLLNNSAAAHISYTIRISGKNYTFDFEAPGIQCTHNLMVQCPAEGIMKQLLIAQYASQVIPRLASGSFGAATTPEAPSAPRPATAPAAPAAPASRP